MRTCDGFFFPVGDTGGAQDAAAQQLACNTMCPAAETKLFTAPPGSDGIEEAVSGKVSYARMPNAFLYQTRLDKACTCNGRSPLGLAAFTVKADYTLDQGDVIMTKDGLKVLASNRYPYTEASFLPATRSKRLSARERDGLRGLETGGRTARLTGATANRQRTLRKSCRTCLSRSRLPTRSNWCAIWVRSRLPIVTLASRSRSSARTSSLKSLQTAASNH